MISKGVECSKVRRKMPHYSSYYTFHIEHDLHLAAELGKTLLERNRELETLLKEKHTTIEDQKLEIEYLTKQTVALKEVNDSRLRIYEQLEVSIQDLERTNHRLQLENSSQRKHVKNLKATIEQLEAKNEELQGIVDDLRLQIDILKKKIGRNSEIGLNKSANQNEIPALRHVQRRENDELYAATSPQSPLQPIKTSSPTSHRKKRLESPFLQSESNSECCTDQPDEENSMEKIAQLLAQVRETRAQCGKRERVIAELEDQLATLEQQNQALENQVFQLSHRGDDLNMKSINEELITMDEVRETRAQCTKQERIIAELEDQLATLQQQNQNLENQVFQRSHKGDDLNMKSINEELNTLDEVRQGQVCSKCLRTAGETSELSLLEETDQSMLEALNNMRVYRSSFHINIQDQGENQSSPITRREGENPYQILVEKFEALEKAHQGSRAKSTKSDQCSSSQEEMQMSGEFALSTKDTDEESDHGGSLRGKQHKKVRKAFSTPTDFSEAETSSSGFADETSNKSTQTEERGKYLCTISDGENCKFSIYDDACPLDTRFRDRPDYRDLFKDIFKVLKKAAENKAEGEELPLLDDSTKVLTTEPAVAPMSQQLLELIDEDSQSIMSSTMSEMSIQNETTTIVENIVQSQNQQILEVEPSTTDGNKLECVLTPLVRQPLEYLSMEVRKRSSSKRKNKYSERSDSPVTHIIGSPKITYASRPNSGRKKKESRNNPCGIENVWNGNTLQFWSSNDRNLSSPTPSQGSGKSCFEFKPSSASQDLHKLKKLDMTYAEVLRKSDSKKQELYKHRRGK
ncbi:myosin heavy chain, clone 203 isoform X3 [Euwallacea fornicatus]|uniref:myosin heavy chain, clone 203 isoform X3 n=1 Tax=Euwallacea fornicatus TaxID=995702 RepID=UPI00338EFC84